MLSRLKSILLYAGEDRETFDNVRDEILESNRSALVVFSSIAAAVMVCLIGMSYFLDILSTNRSAYVICAVLSLIILLLDGYIAKKIRWVTILCEYVFIGTLLIFGIILATVTNPDTPTVNYAVLVFAVPLLFTDRPIRMDGCILLSLCVYFLMAALTQDAEMFQFNVVNVLTYGILAIVASTYMMMIKAQRFALEFRNRYLSSYDVLTGMKNRRSYEAHIEQLQGPDAQGEVTIIALDINGLKKVNDTIGHLAGDELIRGAAECIEAAFGRSGKCYRTGGDEFVVIVEENSSSDDELTGNLKRYTDTWRGTLVNGLSVSAGIARGKTGAGVAELVNLADKRMYKSKAEYYMKNGRDRRSGC